MLEGCFDRSAREHGRGGAERRTGLSQRIAQGCNSAWLVDGRLQRKSRYLTE